MALTRRQMLAAMASTPLLAAARPPARGLSPVAVSRERILKTIVGLRPFRPSGFVVKGENAGDKIIVHNYGHGGGGLSLSWGTAHLAALEVLQTGRQEAAVIGAGAVGLATARLLLERGVKVSIYAKDLPPNTTSNIAGGQWFPFTVYDVDRLTPQFLTQFSDAAQFSWQRFQSLHAETYGIRWLPNYQMSDHRLPTNGLMSRTGPLAKILPKFTELAPGQHPFPFRFARRFDTMHIEPPIYLEAMLRSLTNEGVPVEIREMNAMEELLALPEPVIVNCTGLGSRALLGDEELTPIKGQLTILKPQSEVEYATLPPELYMFPRRDGILLGGTHERGNWDVSVDAEEEERIITSHQEIFAKMARTAKQNAFAARIR